MLRDIKSPAPSGTFNKGRGWCSVSGTAVLFLGLREGRLTMFMASVCALQEQLQDTFCLIVCLFDYLFTWRLFIYMYPYFLIIMYLFTGSLIYFLTYIHSYVFIYSLLIYSFIQLFIHSESFGASHMNTLVFLSEPTAVAGGGAGQPEDLWGRPGEGV